MVHAAKPLLSQGFLQFCHAQKDIWGVNGSSGVKPYLNCINVVLKKRKQRLDAGFVTVECEDLSKLILHSDERRWEAADSATKSYHTLGKRHSKRSSANRV